MTVYILGGSNTAMKGGWGDGLTLRLSRRMPVQNLALGATNTLNAMIRLLSEVTLHPGDVVVWGNAINDAVCLSGKAYTPLQMIGYVETMVRRCQAAGARFVPVLLDSFHRHLMVQQSEYAGLIEGLLAHYRLTSVNLPVSFAAETGSMFIPRQHYMDILHLVPGGDVCEFVSDLAADVVTQGHGTPADVAPLYLDAQTRFTLLRDFADPAQREVFQNQLLETEVWMPPATLRPDLSGQTEATVEAVTMIADPQAGRITMQVGNHAVALSGNHNFTQMGRPIELTTCVPVIAPEGVAIAPGQEIRFDWSTDTAPIPVDMYFNPVPAGPQFGGSAARVVSVLLRGRAA